MIKNRIDELLKKRHKSWYWLAKESGISFSTVYRCKNPDKMPSHEVLDKLCKALKCGPGDILIYIPDEG